MEKHTIFEPYPLGGLTLQNRIIMAPMTRSRSDNPEHKATPLTAIYYQQRASAGLIISEGTYVSTEAVGYIHVPGIHNEAQIAGWKMVTEAVHIKGGKIFAQL